MIKKIAILMISLYQVLVSPFIKLLLGTGAMCRFYETCSAYTKRQIKEQGLPKGLSLGVKRLLKCQPFYKGKEAAF